MSETFKTNHIYAKRRGTDHNGLCRAFFMTLLVNGQDLVLVTEYLLCCKTFYRSYLLQTFHVYVLLVAENHVPVRLVCHGLTLKVDYIFQSYGRQSLVCDFAETAV